jgi:hypothetical protein
MKRCRRIIPTALFGAVLAFGPTAVRAGSDSEAPPPVNESTLPTVAGGASCNPSADAERARKRDAALADLGRRLSAEQKPDPNYQVLNRSGQNYGSNGIQEE